MSRLAKKPVPVTAGITLEVKDRDIVVSSAKGKQIVKMPKDVSVEISAEGASVKALDSSKQSRANSGTTWSLIRNAIAGLSEGFEKILEIEGVGYKAAMEGDTLVLSLGYVLPVKVKVPTGVTAVVEKNTIKVSGMDKQSVGQFAAQIRALKKPEPYKGKGIRYRGEVIRRKVGKKAATA